jgi:hypothetical protein
MINEKIKEIKRFRVRSPARTTFFQKISPYVFQLIRERHRERERSREERVSGGERDHVSLGDDDDDDLSPTSSLKRERHDSFENRSHNGSPIGGANIRIANRGQGSMFFVGFWVGGGSATPCASPPPPNAQAYYNAGVEVCRF